jgi:hypothetical protein
MISENERKIHRPLIREFSNTDVKMGLYAGDVAWSIFIRGPGSLSASTLFAPSARMTG